MPRTECRRGKPMPYQRLLSTPATEGFKVCALGQAPTERHVAKYGHGDGHAYLLTLEKLYVSRARTFSLSGIRGLTW